MASSMKIELRRTLMTRDGRKFPARKTEILHLPLSSVDIRDEQESRREEFSVVRETVTSRFPGVRGEFVLLRQAENGDLVPCNSQAELMKAVQQASGDSLTLYVQEMPRWQKQVETESRVHCSACDELIEGRRVKCLECDDYNLCNQCDEKNIHDHHVMVRAGRAMFFSCALNRFKEVLPELCREVKDKNAGKSLPRLEPRDVRQFWRRTKEEKADGVQRDNDRAGKRRCITEGRRCYERPDKEIRCSNCTGVIEVIRVKCLECNVELCHECDEKNVHGHHVMVKSERQRFFNQGLLAVAEIVPGLCEEARRKVSGEFMPRLSAKEVIQYWRQQRRESKGEEEKRIEMNQQEMRERWSKLLSRMARYHRENMEEKKKERNEEMGEIKRNAEKNDEMAKENIFQMRPQWIQQCRKRWFEEMMRSDECSKGDGGDRPFQVWRPYMRNCWNMWREKMKGCGLDQRCIEKKENQGGCHPRKEWIANCLKMWCEEAEKNCNEWMSDEWKKSGGMADECGGRSKQMMRRGLLPGYHFLMMKSWKMMPDELRCSVKVNSNLPADDDDMNLPSEGEQRVSPAFAKHMMKRCWVDGCRELWWKEARKLLDVDEEKDEQRKMSEKDAMKVMSDQSNWRCYMRQCWRLRNQLRKRCGLVEGNVETAESDSFCPNEPCHIRRGRRAWMEACWPMWSRRMTASGEAESEKKAKQNWLQWKKRPFAGWRPLMIESWRVMEDIPNRSDENGEQRMVEGSNSLRCGRMKKVEDEMKELALEKNKTEMELEENDQLESDEVRAEGPEVYKKMNDGETGMEELCNELVMKNWARCGKRKLQPTLLEGIECEPNSTSSVAELPEKLRCCINNKPICYVCGKEKEIGEIGGEQSGMMPCLKLKLSLKNKPGNLQ